MVYGLSLLAATEVIGGGALSNPMSAVAALGLGERSS